MSTLSDQKTINNKTTVLGPIVKEYGGINLDPALYEGAYAYDADSRQMFFSNGDVWSTGQPPVIATPTGLVPITSRQQRQLRLSGFISNKPGFTQTGMLFLVSLNPDMSNPFPVISVSSTTGSSYDLPYNYSGFTPGTVFYWKGKYTATQGQESYYSATISQTFPEYLDAPTPVTAANIRTNFIKVSDFSSPFDFQQSSVEWLVYGNKDGTGLPLINQQVGYVPGATTNTTLNTLGLVPINTNYWWKARYTTTGGGGHISSYTTPLQQELQVLDIETPSVTSVPGIETVQLAITPYKSLVGPYKQTDWEINTRSDFTGTTVNITNYTNTLNVLDMPSSILYGIVYYFRARYESNATGITPAGISDYTSPASPFIRAALINTPVAVTANGIVTDTLEISQYKSLYLTSIYNNTVWEVYKDSFATQLAFSTVTFNNKFIGLTGQGSPTLIDNQTYYWRAKYTGTITNTTTSISSAYTTLQTYIQPRNLTVPVITQPTIVTNDGGTGVKGPNITFTATPFGYTSIPDFIASSTWQLSLNSSFTQIVDSKTLNVSDSTNPNYPFTWSTSKLVDNSTTYYVRVLYTSTRGNNTGYSSVVTFTTQAAFLDVIARPTKSASYTPAFGELYDGGYYAGKIWNNILTTSDTFSLSGFNQLLVSNTITITTDQYMDLNPAVYVNSTDPHVVQLRWKSDPTINITGNVIKAAGNKLTITITNIDSVGTYYTGSLAALSGWWIMSRFRVLASPISGDLGYIGTLDGSYTIVYSIPNTAFSVCNGYDTTNDIIKNWNNYAVKTSTYYGYPDLTLANTFPAYSAINDLNNSGGINQKTDWYLPSRDEYELIVRNLNPGPADGRASLYLSPTNPNNSYIRPNQYYVSRTILGSIPDNTTLDTYGLPYDNYGSNNNADPPTRSYRDTSFVSVSGRNYYYYIYPQPPAQNFKTGGIDAYSNTYYATSTFNDESAANVTNNANSTKQYYLKLNISTFLFGALATNGFYVATTLSNTTPTSYSKIRVIRRSII